MVREIAAVLLASLVLPAQEPPRRTTVRATGEAVATVKPDIAHIDVGVITEAATAQAASAQNAKQTAGVIPELKRAAGDGAEIETLNYWINPRHKQGDGRAPVIVGYTANNTVRVNVRDLSKVSAVIDAATNSGANSIQGVQFDLKDRHAARVLALKPAATAARANAEAIAASLGLRVVRVISAEEGAPTRFEPMQNYSVMNMASERAQAIPTPIEPRNIQVRAIVTVTLEVIP